MINTKLNKSMPTSININKLTDLLGCFLVTLGGSMLAIIPRIDLTLGGLCIALCGLILMDFNRGGKLGAVQLIEKLNLTPNMTLGILGLGCSVFLGGGEMLDIIRRGQQNNPLEPGYIKVIANAIPYAFAALLSFESLRKQLPDLSDRKVIIMQLCLFATGHLMISTFGYRAGNSAFEIGLVLFCGASLSIISQLTSKRP